MLLRTHLYNALRKLAGRDHPNRCRQALTPDVYLLSFPKTGRTWLRFMIGKALALHYRPTVSDDEILDLTPLTKALPSVPIIAVTHDDSPHRKRPSELNPDKTLYKNKKVILLIRDVRDVVVSMYFHNLKREPGMHLPVHLLADLPAFVSSPVGSLDTIIAYYNIWADNRSVPNDFLLLRYEDLAKSPINELSRVFQFLNLNLPCDSLASAAAYAAFDNMHRLESNGHFRAARLTVPDKSDPEAFKIRRGKVGGYVDYLTPQLADHIHRRVRDQLSPFYGYS